MAYSGSEESFGYGCASRKPCAALPGALPRASEARSPDRSCASRGSEHDARMSHLAQLVGLLGLATKDRTQLVLENVALRHQLAVYKRSVARPNINDRDRVFWLTVMRMLKVLQPCIV